MSADYRLHLALSALHAGVATLRGEDADLNLDVDALLPDAAADVDAAILGVLRAARHATALSESAKAMADDLAERARRFKARSDRLKGIALGAMDAMQRKKIEAPDLTASVRNGVPGVVVTDETALPDSYWRTTRSVDKAALAETLKAGEVVAGAELSNGMPSIQIRSR